MRVKMKWLGRNAELLVGDSGEDHLTNNTWLQAGMMIAVWGKIKVLISKESIYKNKLGKWIAFIIKKQGKNNSNKFVSSTSSNSPRNLLSSSIIQ